MTREEKQYLNDVAQLGCIACRMNGFSGTPAEVHHQRKGTGAGRRASHFDTIPLCPGHHRHDDDAIHRSPKLFEELYGLESELVRKTREDVRRYRNTFVGNMGGNP